MAETINWKNEVLVEDDKRMFTTFLSAKWMQRACEHTSLLSEKASPLVFALGSDATNVVNWGNRQFHPIYLWILNDNDIEQHPNKVSSFLYSFMILLYKSNSSYALDSL